jgi:hypothetical protein
MPPLVFLAVAAIFVLLSWDLQKGKAIKRFRALRAKDLDAYFALDDGNPSYGLDRYAAVLLVIGIILEGFQLLKPTL